jgi:hypothetical protein
MAASNLALADDREVDREEVHFRARATGPGGRPLRFLVVNISPHGLMTRCEEALAAGDMVRVQLPALGTVFGEVRWALGGRAGIQFERMIELAPYYALLSAVVKGR